MKYLAQRSRPFTKFVVIAAALMLPWTATTSPHTHAQEVSAKLIGGGFYPESAGGKVAYILTDTYSCSGVLVGTREVLTAAHCVVEGPDAPGYAVYVGGAWRQVESAWYNARFDPNKSTLRMARFDLGMLILTEPVTGTDPFPVLKGRRLSSGATIFIAGYGANERSHQPDRTFIDNFKLGAARLTRAERGMLFGNHRAYRSSPCSGDSGGPATFEYKKDTLAVAGVLSAGINRVINDRCRLNSDGSFIEVDLQSTSSQEFLSFFPGVQYAQGRSAR